MAPARHLELKGCVLEGSVSGTVGEVGLEALLVGGIPLEGDVLRIIGNVALAVLVAIVVVAAAGDERDLVVNPFKGAADALPHLGAALVEHPAVKGVVLVLLHKVAGAEDCLDVEMVYVVGNPKGRQLEDGLVDVVLDIALGISEKDHRG